MSAPRRFGLALRARIANAFIVDNEDAALKLRKITGGTGAAIRVRESHDVPDPSPKTPMKPATRIDKSKRLLILATDNCTVGGIQRYAWTWGEVALDLGYAPRFAALWKRGAVNGVRVSPQRAAWFTIKAIASAILRPPRAVISTHVALAPVARIISMLTRSKYVVALHGDDAWHINGKTTVAAVKQADLRLPVSHFTKKVVSSSLDLPPDKFYVTGSILAPRLQLGTKRSCRKNESGTSRVRAAFSLSGDRENIPRYRYLLTVARLDLNAPYKRHDLVIRAVAELRDDYPDLRYHIVGDGPYRAELEALAEKLEVADRVDFLGRLSERELARENAGAYAFVMPSRISLDPPAGEGFGLVYLEAGIYGVPSIAANGGGSTETVLDGITGILVEPDSLQSLVAGIRKLLDDRALRDRLGAEAPRRAIEFSYPIFRRKCAAVLAALAEGKDPREIEPEHDPHEIAGWARL